MLIGPHPQEMRGARASNRSMCQSVSFEVLYLNKWKGGWRVGRVSDENNNIHISCVLILSFFHQLLPYIAKRDGTLNRFDGGGFENLRIAQLN